MTILDTNVVDAVVQGRFDPQEKYLNQYKISAITLGECLRGWFLYPHSRTLAAVASLVGDLDESAILPYGPEEARVFARIAGRVTARKRIPDLMIAATAIVAGLPLVTFDTGLDGIARELAANGPADLALTVHLLEE